MVLSKFSRDLNLPSLLKRHRRVRYIFQSFYTTLTMHAHGTCISKEVVAATTATASIEPTSFIKQIIEEDLKTGKHSQIITRFPPEPNGFLHIGHSKAICLNYGLAKQYKGTFHLRFDDTNPTTEEMRYIESIKEDVKWLGADWGEHLYFASDYFSQLFDWAVALIKKGLAYVDHQTNEEIRLTRGTLKTPGTSSKYRERSVQENLDFFYRMAAGEFKDGTCVLRAKIDMTSSNMNLRDPILYRILNTAHPRTGDKWKVYPTYDFAHGQSDSIERITHSLCTLEFELHRPLYDWFQEKLDIYRTRQIESARMNVSHMITSKRKLLALVEEKYVTDWDDPRMPTLAGMRRRGYPAAAIVDFCSRVGVAKRENLIKIDLLEQCTREHLHKVSKRKNVILSPLKVILTNFPEDSIEEIDVPNHPENNEMGTRKLLLSKELYIDKSDFEETPREGFYRLSPGEEVRLRYAYFIKCEKVLKDELGHISALECTFDAATKGGRAADGRKVKGTIHWVTQEQHIPVEIRMFGRLFTVPNPNDVDSVNEASDSNPNSASNTETGSSKNWRQFINPKSLMVYKGVGEASLTECVVGEHLQFERIGFFTKDRDSTEAVPVFNLTLDLLNTVSPLKVDAADKNIEKLEREKKAAMRQARKDLKLAKKVNQPSF